MCRSIRGLHFSSALLRRRTFSLFFATILLPFGRKSVILEVEIDEFRHWTDFPKVFRPAEAYYPGGDLVTEQIKTILELFAQPAFFAKDDRVLWCNAAARSLVLEDTELAQITEDRDILFSAWDRVGTLQIALRLCGQLYDACVRVYEDALFFVVGAKTFDDRVSARAVFVASASMRKPLHGLLNAATQLFDEYEDVSTTRTAASVNQSIYQLIRLCNQMTDGSRLLLGQMEVRRTATNLQSFFDDFVSQVRPLVEGSGRMLHYFPLRTQVIADVDTTLLERAMMNLFSNALTYTKKDGTITLQVSRQDHHLLVRVSDDGDGISSKVVANLFKRYSDHPIGDARWGLGYGLPMVREIARLHDGTLAVSSNDTSSGTTALFSISLARTVLELHSPQLRYDYCGGLNHALVELSDALDAENYIPDLV